MADDEGAEWIERIQAHVVKTAPRCLNDLRAKAKKQKHWQGGTTWVLSCKYCGHDKGEVLGYSGRKFNPEYKGPESFVGPLAFRCASCAKVAEIMDPAIHGLNGEIDRRAGRVSKDSRLTGERKPFPCLDCAATSYAVTLGFSFDHFDVVEDEPELESVSQDWFHSFSCNGRCVKCGKQQTIANYETA
jgi:hypothetical protein